MDQHPRKLIREAAAKALKFKTAAQQRVFETRMVPWKPAELPGIAIYTLEESSALIRPDLDRTLTLAILGVVSLGGDGNVDDALDALALEIEKAMNADPRIGGTATLSYLSATTIEVDEQGREIGAVRLSYTVKYHTSLRTQGGST